MTKLLMLPLALLVASSGSIPFRPVAQGAPPGTGDEQPQVYLVTSVAGLGRLAARVPVAMRERVRAVPLAGQAVVAVFAGERPTGGWSVTVRSLTVDGGRLRITVDLRRPRPGSIVTQVFTSPFHVVSIGREPLGRRLPSAYTLVDVTGRALATGVLSR